MPIDENTPEENQEKVIANPNEVDYFTGRLTNEISLGAQPLESFAYLANQLEGKDVTMKSADEYWEDDKYKQAFENNREAFDETYGQISRELQSYDSLQFDAFRTSERMVRKGFEWLSPELKTRKHFFKVDVTNETNSGARLFFDGYTADTRDEFQRSIESGVWYDEKGNRRTLDEFSEYGVDSFNDLIQEEYSNSADGREIKAFVYDSNVVNDPYYRGPVGMHAVYEGEYSTIGSKNQVMSFYDAAGWTSWDTESQWYDFIGRTAANFIPGIVKSIGAFSAAQSRFLEGAADYLGLETLSDMYKSAAEIAENEFIMPFDVMQVSQAKESREGGIFETADNFLGLVADVGLQLAFGKGSGSAGMGWSALAGGRMTKAGGKVLTQFNKFDANVGKYTSIAAMTLYGGADMYGNAMANGFTPREAAALYTANLGALFAVNKTFNILDDTFAASGVAKNNSKWINKNLAYVAEEVKQLREAGKDIMTSPEGLSLLQRFSKGSLDAAKKVAKQYDKISGYPKAMIQESLEESFELIGEETVKNFGNFYSYIKNGERVDIGEGRFKDMFDEGYWEEFGENLLASAIGGAIGGAVGKAMFKSNRQSKETKDRVIDILNAGDGEALLEQIDKNWKAGELGPKDISTTFDEKTKTYLKMDQAGEGAVSMNDANRQLLLQEIAYAQGIIDKFGAKKAFETMIKENSDLDNIKSFSGSIAQDLREATKEYVNLVSENDLEQEEISPFDEDEAFKNAKGETREEKEAEVQKLKKEHYESEANKNNTEADKATRIGELKQQIKDIESGKAVERYFFEAISHEFIDKEKYGKDFLYRLMQSSDKSAQIKREKRAQMLEVMKANESKLDDIKEDFSNLEEIITELIDPETKTFLLSDKGKKDLIKKLESYKADENQLETIKEKIKETIVGEEIYSVENLLQDPLIESISPNKKVRAKAAKFASEFLNTKLEEELASANSIEEVLTLKKDNNGLEVIFVLDSIIEEQQADGDFSLKKKLGGSESIVDFLTKNNTADVRAMAKELGSMMANNFEYNSNFRAEAGLENYTNSSLAPVILSIAGKADLVKQAKELVEKTQGETEENFQYDADDVSYLQNGWVVTEDGSIKDEGNVVVTSRSIIDQFESQKLGEEDETSMFNDLESVVQTLTQIKGRKSQIEMLVGLGEFSPVDTGHISNLRTRINRALDIDSKLSGLEKIKKEQTDQERINGTKFVQDSVFDSETYFKLRQKETEGVLSVEEKERLESLNNTLGRATFLLEGNKEQLDNLNKKVNDGEELTEEEETRRQELTQSSFEGLNGLEARLEKIKEILLKNLEDGGAIRQQKGLMVAKLQEEKLVLNNLLDLAFENSEDENIKQFLEDFGQFSLAKIEQTDESITEAFGKIAAAKKLLFETFTQEEKDSLANEYNDTYLVGEENVKKYANELRSVIFSLKVNQEEFYKEYKSMLLTEGMLSGVVPLVQQEEVALSVVAHATTDSAALFNSIADVRYANHDNDAMMFVEGLQGTGKSTYSLGVGIKIASAILEKSHGKERSRVLLASNSEEQVAVLEKTAEEFGYKDRVKQFGSDYGVTSVIDEEGNKRPATLIKLLKTAADNKGQGLDGVSTIIFDEATYLEYNYEDSNINFTNSSDLNKINILINKINKDRSADQPKLKIILTGDSKQNGFTSESGDVRNIGGAAYTSVFRSPALKVNMRSQILSRADHLQKILSVSESSGKLINELKSEYGIIKDDTKLGGIRYNNNNEDFFNSESIVNNIREQIEISKNDDSRAPFSVGIILPEGQTIDNIPEDSLLRKLMEENEGANLKHFVVTTHDHVQGGEFDYVIMKVTGADIGNLSSNPSFNQERAYAKKLSTSIGRARYFTAVINDTDRDLTSESVEDITIPPAKTDAVAAEQIKETKIKMIPGEVETTSKPVVSEKQKEEILSAKQSQKEKKEKREKEIKEKKEKEEKSEKISKELAEEEAELREMLKGRTTLINFGILNNIKDPGVRIDMLREAAKKLNAEKQAEIEMTAAAKRGLESADIAERIVATLYSEDSEFKFTPDNINAIREQIENETLSGRALEIYNEEKTKDELEAKSNQDSSSTDIEEKEVKEEKEEEEIEEKVNSINEKYEDSQFGFESFTLDELYDEKDSLVQRQEETSEDYSDQIRELNDRILAKETENSTADLDNLQDISDALEMGFGVDENFEANTKKDGDEDRVVMEEMEERLGLIAAYSHHQGYGKIPFFEAEQDYLKKLFIGSGSQLSIPKTESEYKEHQLAAMGLRKNEPRGNYSYELRAYKQDGFTKIAIVATHNTKGVSVIVGGFNQYKFLKGERSKLFREAVEEIFNNPDNITTEPGRNVATLKRPIKINNPSKFLNLSLLSPGSLKRGKKIKLSEWEKLNKNKGVNVSNHIFISTDVTSKYKGQAFLLYSFDSSTDFSAYDVDDLLKNGIEPISREHGDILKGYKGGVGIIRLDTAGLFLQDINKMMGDTFSKEAINLTDNVNRSIGQERLVLALGQIFYTASELENRPEQVHTNVKTLLTNRQSSDTKENLQFDGQFLSTMLDNKKKENPEIFEAAMVALNNLLGANRNLGNEIVNEQGEIKYVKQKDGSVRPMAKSKGAVSILLSENYEEANSDTVEIAMHKLIGTIRNAAKDSDVSVEEVLILLDEILVQASNFQYGMKLHPGIQRGKNESDTGRKGNTVFAVIDNMPGLKDAFEITVGTDTNSIQTPSFRISLDSLVDLLSKPQEDTAQEKPVSEEEKKRQEQEEEVDEFFKKPWADLSEIIEEANTTNDLTEAKTEIQSEFKRIKELINKINDVNKRDSLSKDLDKLQKQFKSQLSKKSRSLKKGNNKPSIKEHTDKLNNNASNLLNNNETVKKQIKQLKEEGSLIPHKESEYANTLTEEQYYFVHTPFFQEWSGDWQNSQVSTDLVTTREGQPIPFYSYTPKVAEDSRVRTIVSNTNVFGTSFSSNPNAALEIAINKIDSYEMFVEMFGEIEGGQEIFNIVKNYVRFRSSNMLSEMTDTNVKVAEKFIDDNFETREVFIKGNKQQRFTESNPENPDTVVSILADNYDMSNIELTQDVILINNSVVSSQQQIPSTIAIVKDLSNVRMVDGGSGTDIEFNADESQYLTEAKKEIANLVENVKQLLPFIKDEQSLLELAQLATEQEGSINLRMARVTDRDSDKIELIDDLSKQINVLLKEAQISLLSNPDEFRKGVKDFMNQEFKLSDVPSFKGNPNSLTGLLVKYHEAKASGENTDTLAERINDGWFKTSQSPQEQLNDIINSDVTTIEQFEEKAAVIERFYKDKNFSMTKNERDSYLERLLDKLKEIENLKSVIAEGEIDLEKLNEIEDSDFKVMLEESLTENISDDAIKTINSTLGGLNNLLSSGEIIGDTARAEVVERDLIIEKAKALEKIEALLTFVLNEGKRKMIEKLAADKIKAIEAEAPILDQINEVKANAAAAAAASNQNFDLSINNLTPPAFDENNKLSLKNEETIKNAVKGSEDLWINILSGGEVNPMDRVKLNQKLKEEANSNENLEKIMGYMSDQISNRNKICGK